MRKLLLRLRILWFVSRINFIILFLYTLFANEILYRLTDTHLLVSLLIISSLFIYSALQFIMLMWELKKSFRIFHMIPYLTGWISILIGASISFGILQDISEPSILILLIIPIWFTLMGLYDVFIAKDLKTKTR